MLVDPEEGIGVVAHHVFMLLVPSCQHYRIVLLRTLQDVLDLVLFVFEEGSYGGVPCEVFHELIRRHHLGSVIAADQLGPGLLDEEHPDFIPDGLAKQRLERRRIAGDVVVQDHESRLSSNVEAKNIEPQRKIVEGEDFLDFLGVAGQVGDGGQAVAHSKQALLDVVGEDSVEQLEVLPKKGVGPEPDQTLQEGPNLDLVLESSKGIPGLRELFVNEEAFLFGLEVEFLDGSREFFEVGEVCRGKGAFQLAGEY